MSNETTTQPSVTEAQIQAVMTTISDKLGGAFVTPQTIEPILEGMVSENNALAPIANAVWDIAQRMHKQAGEAVTMVAMQKAMMDELHLQRNQLVLNAHKEGYGEGYNQGLEVAEDCLLEQGALTFAQGIADNDMSDEIDELQAEVFSDAFYEGDLDDTAKQMLKELILYVWERYQEEAGEVEF